MILRTNYNSMPCLPLLILIEKKEGLQKLILRHYNMFEDFELMKRSFVDKGIPVIISEVGVLTEEKKEIESIREYLYMLFSFSSDYDGIMCCLWDTSNKIFGDMNFYDRTNDIWYDEKIKNNFLQISKGKYIKPKDYYVNTTFESTNIYSYFGEYQISFEDRKVLKISYLTENKAPLP